MPLMIWMKQKKFKEIIEDATSADVVHRRGTFNASELQATKCSFFNSADNSTRNCRAYLKVWLANLTELWIRRFM